MHLEHMFSIFQARKAYAKEIAEDAMQSENKTTEHISVD
jgi:hypothetical protein